MKAVKVEVVANKTRTILELPQGGSYVYIPMTEEEAKLFPNHGTNLCWRIELSN